jgi:hypothetical protein
MNVPILHPAPNVQVWISSRGVRSCEIAVTAEAAAHRLLVLFVLCALAIPVFASTRERTRGRHE